MIIGTKTCTWNFNETYYGVGIASGWREEIRLTGTLTKLPIVRGILRVTDAQSAPRYIFDDGIERVEMEFPHNIQSHMLELLCAGDCRVRLRGIEGVWSFMHSHRGVMLKPISRCRGVWEPCDPTRESVVEFFKQHGCEATRTHL